MQNKIGSELYPDWVPPGAGQSDGSHHIIM
jgi:hypothetical protein